MTKLQHKVQRWATRLEQNGKHCISRLQQLEQRTYKAPPNAIQMDAIALPLPNYDSLKSIATGSSFTQSFYSGRLDSLTIALKLLQLEQGQKGRVKNVCASTLDDMNKLYDQLNTSAQANAVLYDRLAHFKSLPRTVLPGQVLRLYQKQISKFSKRLETYKALVERPDRSAGYLLSEIQKLPEFTSFFARNARLGKIFSLPGSQTEDDRAVATSGLQTRAALEQAFKDRYGSTANLSAALQRNLPSAGSMGNLASTVDGHSPDALIPGKAPAMPAQTDRFKEGSNLLGKPFSLGVNLQTTPARHFFPATSDLGLHVGYRINPRSMIGIGGSYKLGLGKSWDNIKLTHEGLSLRSFVDVQLKGSVYISGGYEQHYRTAISSVAALKDHSAWQSSGLVGLSKRYRVGRLNGNMQLMWDVLSSRQVPKTQPIVWRFGYLFQ